MATTLNAGRVGSFPAPPDARRRLPGLVVLLLTAVLACGSPPSEEGPAAGEAGRDPPTETPSGESEGDEGRDVVSMAELGDFRSLGQGPEATSFAHGVHDGIDCRGCHGQPTGHGTHTSVPCSECHGAVGGVEGRNVPTPSECLACHHDPARPDPCVRCHQDAEALPAASVPRTLALATALRDRALPFRHAVHEAVECESCHGVGVTRVQDVDCVSCHERHHGATADCASCHRPPPPGAHDVEAHRGCAGSGCHDDPTLEALPDTRAFCLSCHTDQDEHEPGRVCAPCHQLGTARGGSS